jgi:cytidylate kinase
MSKSFSIAIDGPAAAGKGTIVQMLTSMLSGSNIYTGGMYRALGLKCIRNNVSLDDSSGIVKILHESDINLGVEDTLGVVAKIYLDGEDVTEKIKNPAVAIAAGKVALIREVREEMVSVQRKIAEGLIKKGKIAILDGQDTALIIPEAKLKLFLTASPEVRATRRQKQYEKQDIDKSFESVLEEIKDRDARDWSREICPISKDPIRDGYFLIDSSNLNEQETINVIIGELRKRGLINDQN